MERESFRFRGNLKSSAVGKEEFVAGAVSTSRERKILRGGGGRTKGLLF